MLIDTLGLFFGAYVLGACSDKLGKRSTLLYSLFLAGLMQSLSALAIAVNHFEWFLVFRFFSGFFEGNISIARAAIATLCPNEGMRKKHMGQTDAALTAGWILGPALGALLNKLPFFNGFLLPFACGSLLTFIAFYFAYRYFHEPMNASSPVKNMAPHIMTDLTNASVMILLTVSFLLFLGVDAFYTFIPLYLTLALNAPPAILALSVTTVAFFNVLSNMLLLPKLGSLVDTKKTIIICALLLSICLLCFAVFKSSYILLLLLPMIGINLALTTTNIATYISMRLKLHKQGALMGILLSQRTLGVVLLCFIFVFIINIDLRMPFLFGSLCLLAGALLLATYSLFNKKLSQSFRGHFGDTKI